MTPNAPIVNASGHPVSLGVRCCGGHLGLYRIRVSATLAGASAVPSIPKPAHGPLLSTPPAVHLPRDRARNRLRPPHFAPGGAGIGKSAGADPRPARRRGSRGVGSSSGGRSGRAPSAGNQCVAGALAPARRIGFGNHRARERCGNPQLETTADRGPLRKEEGTGNRQRVKVGNGSDAANLERHHIFYAHCFAGVKRFTVLRPDQ